MINDSKMRVTHLDPGTLAKIKKQQAAQKAKTQKAESTGTPAALPSESFVPSSKPSEAVQANTKTTEVSETAVEKQPDLKTPRPGSSMADMLENIENAKMAGGEVTIGDNGTLLVLDGSSFIDNQIEEAIVVDRAKQQSGQVEDGQGETKGHDHGHGHGGDSAMGGHLGTEVVEKMGHHAHHATSAAGHGKAEVLTQAVTHGKAEAVGHAAAAKGHIAHVAHDASGAAAQASETLASTSEALGDVAQAGQQAHIETTPGIAHEAVKHGKDAAHHLSTGMETALQVSAGASFGVGAYMLYSGGKEFVAGVKEKSGEKIAEGVGQVFVGARSLAATAVMGAMSVSAETTVGAAFAAVAPAAGKLLTPLGVLHGAIDVGLGVKDIATGKDKIGGALKIGFGAAVAAGAAIGGIPLTVAAIGALGAKVGYGIYKGRKEKKAAKEAAAQQQQQAPPQIENPKAKDTNT